MTVSTPDPLAAALFVMTAFAIAGLLQAAWLSSRPAQRLAWPLDGGCRIRGRRLFGSNKTVRGLVAMPPCTGAAFLLLAGAAPHEVRETLWILSPAGYAALGALAGAGCMLGELPNSFLKRQLDIPPGAAASGALRPLFLVIDRLDSSLGALIALALVVPVPSATAICIVIAGPLMHTGLSLLTFRLGGKARAA